MSVRCCETVFETVLLDVSFLLNRVELTAALPAIPLRRQIHRAALLAPERPRDFLVARRCGRVGDDRRRERDARVRERLRERAQALAGRAGCGPAHRAPRAFGCPPPPTAGPHAPTPARRGHPGAPGPIATRRTRRPNGAARSRSAFRRPGPPSSAARRAGAAFPGSP